MERLSLFENITSPEDASGKTLIHLTKNDACKHFVLDWTEKQTKKLEIIIDTEVTLDVLEVAGKVERTLDITLLDHARLEWRTVNLTHGKNANVHYHLNAFASLDFAFADFSKGTETLDMVVDLSGPSSSVTCHMAALSYENDQKTISVSVQHQASDTYGLVSAYGVAQGTGMLKFSGISHIFKGAPKSKTHQNAKIMVFDPHSIGRANPILKIDENDVEASHSAAVGKVNDEHLFYLCSRGLTPQEAKRLITMGYLHPIIRYFNEEKVQKDLEKAIKGRI